MTKKTNSFKNIITVLLTLLLLGIDVGPASAAADIDIDNARITSSNKVVVTFVAHSDSLIFVDQTKWHIDVGDGGITPLNSTIAALTSVTSPYVITLTFPGTPFSDISKSYSASEGLYVDNIGVATTSSTNTIVTHDVSKAIADGQAPTVALTYSANPAKAGAMTITATYSEAIVGTPKISINQPGTADITAEAMSGGSTVWTYAYTVNTATGGTYIDGNATVSLSTVADAATNNAGAPTGTTFTIDTTAPTVALTYSVNPAKAGAMTVTATYSESIIGTPSISINQPGSTDITAVSMIGGPTVWTYNYTVNTATGGAYLDGNATVSLSTVADAATNNAGAPIGTTFTIDTTTPTVALTYSANPAKAGVMTITATYSEAIVDTPSISIDQPGSTEITAVPMSGGPTVWTYSYTVNTATGGAYVDGTTTVSLSTVSDAATNNAGSPTGTTFTIDTTAPTVALTHSANPAKAGAMTITATYSEAIFGTPKISIDQPGSTDITAVSMSGGPTVWTYAYTVNTATGGTYVDGPSTVSLSTVADAATNNAGSPTGTTFTIDTTSPTVALTHSANPAKAGAMTITATYSEAIVGTPSISINQPGTNDITVQTMSGGPTVWTYSYTVNTATGGAYVDGTATVSLSTVADAATNNAGVPTGTTFTIDTTAPTFIAARTAPNTIVLAFSENVDVSTIAGVGYTLSSGIVTANTDPAGSGNTITLTTSGVSGSPTVTYGAAAGTTVDTAGNEVADGFKAVASSGSAASLVVTANNSAPQVNGNITINATVKDSSGVTSGSLGTGTISFLANGIMFASATLSEGVAGTTYTKATAGAVTITAFYNSTLQNTTTVTFMPAVLPALTVSASSATVIVGTPTSVSFNVTSGGIAIDNATVTLSQVATGSGTTNASGLTVISVTATNAGTITATANMSGYTIGILTINASAAGSPSITGVTISPTNPSAGDEINITLAINNPGASFTGRVEGNVWSPTGKGKYLGWEDVVIPSGVSTVTIIGPAGGEKSSYISHQAGTHLYDVFLENVDDGEVYLNATDSRLGVAFTVGTAASVYMSNVSLSASPINGSAMTLNVTISNPTASAFNGVMNANIWDSASGHALAPQTINITAGGNTTLAFRYTPVNTGLHSYDFFMVSAVSGQNTKAPWDFPCMDYVAGIGFTVV